MKKLLSLIFVICGLMSCENIVDYVAPEIRKEYINHSGVDIELVAYKNKISHTYTIADGESITLSFCDDTRNLKYDENFMFHADSIKVIYGEERISKMSSFPDLCGYPTITEEISKRGYVHAEPFTFTREMYDAAIPIEK